MYLLGLLRTISSAQKKVTQVHVSSYNGSEISVNTTQISTNNNFSNFNGNDNSYNLCQRSKNILNVNNNSSKACRDLNFGVIMNSSKSSSDSDNTTYEDICVSNDVYNNVHVISTTIGKNIRKRSPAMNVCGEQHIGYVNGNINYGNVNIIDNVRQKGPRINAVFFPKQFCLTMVFVFLIYALFLNY